MSVIPGKPGLATFGDYPHGLGRDRHMTGNTEAITPDYAAGWADAIDHVQVELDGIRHRLPTMEGPGDVDEALRALHKRLSAIVVGTREEPAHKTLEGHHDHHQP